MAYEFFVLCDLKECNGRVQVGQAQALPKTWVVVRFLEMRLDAKSGNVQDQLMELSFCSWKCAHKFVKARLIANPDTKQPIKLVLPENES